METKNKVYIRGNAEHPEAVLRALKSHGAKRDAFCDHPDSIYRIDNYGYIVEIPDCWITELITTHPDWEEIYPEPDYKFKVGDKVINTISGKIAVITDAYNNYGKAAYALIENGYIKQNISYILECDLAPYTEPKDITEHIKTFDDACEWCKNHDKENLVIAYLETYFHFKDMKDMEDILAYLRLRIIICALNEGWEPTFEKDEFRYTPNYHTADVIGLTCFTVYGDFAYKLAFKTKELAFYAAKQFKDIYMDFCKGKD